MSQTTDAMEKNGRAITPHRILVVDDETTIVEMLGKLLRRAEFEVVTAGSAEEALEYLKDHEVSMVISDHVMPGMQGAELLGWVRTEYPDAIRIMMTGFTDMKAAAQAVNEAQIYHFFLKPWDTTNLLEIVKNGLRHYEVVLENRMLNERVRAQNRKLKEQNEKLIELDRIKINMTNMIIHDLKGPLAGIMANLDLLSFGELDEEDRESADLASEGCQDLLRLIMNILNVSKLEDDRVEVNYREVEVEDMLRTSLDQLLGIARIKELKVTPQVEKGLTKMVADPELLGRVVVNLLSNAIHYSPEGEKIFVTAAPAADNDMVTISIRDFGPGISPSQAETIFDRFSQVDGDSRRSSFSTGIGLAFCKLAVEAHGGTIWVESEQDKGSIFHFRVPASPGSETPR